MTSSVTSGTPRFVQGALMVAAVKTDSAVHVGMLALKTNERHSKWPADIWTQIVLILSA